MPRPADSSRRSLIAPRHWPSWLGLGLLWLCHLLPYGLQLRLGRGLGGLFYRLAPRRRHIAAVNLQLCFPELSGEEREGLLRGHFASVGISLLESGLAWWGSERRLRALGQIEGLDNLLAPLGEGRGVILAGGHFTCLEIVGRLVAQVAPLHVLYREHENPVVEHMLRNNRARIFSGAIARDDIRGMMRALRRGEAVWYAPDQNFGHRHSVFAPFFGIPAATTTSTHRLSRSTGAAVVPIFFCRKPGGGYRIDILPALADFPSEDAAADTARFNALLERYVRRAPEQYLWMHRRFKDRPAGEPNLYERGPR